MYLYNNQLFHHNNLVYMHIVTFGCFTFTITYYFMYHSNVHDLKHFLRVLISSSISCTITYFFIPFVFKITISNFRRILLICNKLLCIPLLRCK
jgi:antibiotic biosynthesis monooxygenase (ABM) superfamily enzyme